MKPYLLLLSVWMLLNACSPSYKKFIPSYERTVQQDRPNYDDLYYWAAHPNKRDPSDSIPKPLRKSYQKDSTIDVFFVHPTTLTSYEDARVNAPIDDAALNAKTDYTSILLQASAFNSYNIYAPRYRQAHIRNYYPLDTPLAVRAFDTAYADIRTAFKYFLQQRNPQHGIIIASHSQGSTHSMHLLREFFDTTDLKNKLVAAYIVGMYLPEDYFSNLKACDSSSNTECFCSWRTYKIGYVPPFVQKEKKPSVVTNPISWNRTEEWATRKNNQGAVLANFKKLYKKAADAKIHGGILWTHHPRFPFSFLFRYKNYHIGDINLYYMNVRNNAQERVRSFNFISGN